MITLYSSGPNFGLPAPSPFVIKTEMLLKMAGLPYGHARMSFSKAPKGKIPYIEEAGKLLGDSHFIQRHLETIHGANFDGGYGASDLAVGWAVSRMMEERFYFLLVHERWMDDANFNAGPRVFFNDAPAPIRPLLRKVIRRKVSKMLIAQGHGRHSDAERADLARDDVAAIETLLDDNKYFLGEHVSGVDASLLGMLWSASVNTFKGPVGDAVRNRPKVMAYINRLVRQYFPEFASA